MSGELQARKTGTQLLLVRDWSPQEVQPCSACAQVRQGQGTATALGSSEQPWGCPMKEGGVECLVPEDGISSFQPKLIFFPLNYHSEQGNILVF